MRYERLSSMKHAELPSRDATSPPTAEPTAAISDPVHQTGVIVLLAPQVQFHKQASSQVTLSIVAERCSSSGLTMRGVSARLAGSKNAAPVNCKNRMAYRGLRHKVVSCYCSNTAVCTGITHQVTGSSCARGRSATKPASARQATSRIFSRGNLRTSAAVSAQRASGEAAAADLPVSADACKGSREEERQKSHNQHQADADA